MVKNQKTENLLKVVRAIAVVISIASTVMFVVHIIFYIPQQPLRVTALDPNEGLGLISDNTFDNKETILMWIGNLFFYSFILLSFNLAIGPSAAGNIILAILNGVLALVSLGLIIAEVIIYLIPCNLIGETTYYNMCNSIYYCCIYDVHMDPDSLCPNAGMNCTAGIGKTISEGELGYITYDPWYATHFAFIIIFGVFSLVGLILSIYAAYNTREQLEGLLNVLNTLGQGVQSFMGRPMNEDQIPLKSKKPFFKKKINFDKSL